MGSKAKTDPRDTYIFSDEVMDEMQNLEASAELLGLEDLPQDDDDEIAATTLTQHVVVRPLTRPSRLAPKRFALEAFKARSCLE